tara:strand:- start:1574 stop:2782 length:1209 start_codon:yes stop_codon:yes gene_type:complete
MKIRPVILCGGEGTRLWPNSKKNQAKQFINFGDETLIEKTLKRIKGPIFDYPILSTNLKYLKKIKKYLKKLKIKKYKIILEPFKRNTAPAILASALIKEIPNNQPLMFLPADHTIENINLFNKTIFKNKKNLTGKNIFIFGIKPTFPSSDYGYFLSKKYLKNTNKKVIRFIEKPNKIKAKKIIKMNGYWNSGMFFFRKDAIIYNFKKFSPNIFKNCNASVKKAKISKNVYYLNKASFYKVASKSFDYAILEKSNQINAINLNLPWSDLGSWKEILKQYNKTKTKFFKKKNVYYRPWGKYINLFKGKNFLIKELTINSKSSISLQKHYHRSEFWLITQGKAKITLNKNKFYKTSGEDIYIPAGTIHRVENLFRKPIKIMESQIGSILKETDIVRFQDVYGRVI